MQALFQRIAILLINFRTTQLTLDCLASIDPERMDNPGLNVLLVDNGSNDDSPDRLEAEVKSRAWDTWVKLVRLPKNRGFSGGNNAGIAAAKELGTFDAYLLLNSDTVLRGGALSALAQTLRGDDRIGLVGPRLEWPNGDHQASCFRNLSPVSELKSAAKTGPVSRLFPGGDVPIFEPKTTNAIEWISFACVLIRGEVIDSIGFMDEGFFMYFEDVDYCRRARNAGWKIAYAPRARVVHLRGGQSPENFADAERKRRPAFYYESRARYMAKYYGRTGPWRANTCWLLGRAVSFMREIVGNKRPHTAACEATDIWKGSLCGFAKQESTRHA